MVKFSRVRDLKDLVESLTGDKNFSSFLGSEKCSLSKAAAILDQPRVQAPHESLPAAAAGQMSPVQVTVREVANKEKDVQGFQTFPIRSIGMLRES